MPGTSFNLYTRQSLEGEYNAEEHLPNDPNCFMISLSPLKLGLLKAIDDRLSIRIKATTRGSPVPFGKSGLPVYLYTAR